MTLTLDNINVENANKIVCVFCNDYADEFFCSSCNEYKGLMTLAEWLAYTGDVWEM